MSQKITERLYEFPNWVNYKRMDFIVATQRIPDSYISLKNQMQKKNKK